MLPSNLFVVKNFLDIAVCHDLLDQAEQSVAVPAKVSKATGRVDINMRQTSRLSLSAETEELINGYFSELKPQLEKHFSIQLSGFERFQFLLYQQGDFYKRHADRNDNPESPDYIRARRVSVVIFLSDEGQNDQREQYTGGKFVIWSDGPQKAPISIDGEISKLIAFPSDLLHEVEPVHSGKRFSIVNWFFE